MRISSPTSPQHRALFQLWKGMALVVLFGLLHGCSSFEFGVYAELVSPPFLLVKISCPEPSSPAELTVTAKVQVTMASQSAGNVGLRRVVMEYCVNPIIAQQTRTQEQSTSKTSCEAVTEYIGTEQASATRSCPFFVKRTCMPSLRFPRVLTCKSTAESNASSPCFLEQNKPLTYEGQTGIPLLNINEPGFQPRTNQAWSRTCCEFGSEACTSDADCKGRGTCQGRCRNTGETCTENSACPARQQACKKLCDDLFQVCNSDSECPPVDSSTPGTCKQRCQITGTSCTTSCDPVPQTCLRYCRAVGNTCTDDAQCAPGEVCKPPLCSTSGTPCTSTSNCPQGETCEPRTCIVAGRLMTYVGLQDDFETTFSQNSPPNTLRLLCQDKDGKPLSPMTQCTASTSATAPPSSICPKQ